MDFHVGAALAAIGGYRGQGRSYRGAQFSRNNLGLLGFFGEKHTQTQQN